MTCGPNLAHGSLEQHQPHMLHVMYGPNLVLHVLQAAQGGQQFRVPHATHQMLQVLPGPVSMAKNWLEN